jgi:hypothetical protein
MRFSVIPISVLAFVVVAAGFLTLPNASAADVAYYSAYPSANNATYEKWVGAAHYGPYPSSGTKVYNDSSYQDIYSSDIETYYKIIAWDFNNDDYEFVGTEYQVNVLPPTGATILDVKIVAKFSAYTTHPTVRMAYSLNSGSTWNTSSVYYSYQSVTWDVDSLEDWTPENINTTTTMIRMEVYPDALYTHYYVDYIGWYISFLGAEGGPYDPGTGPGEDDDSGADIGLDLIYSGEGIIGLLGAVGFVGMIAVPAFAIYAYRNSPDETRIGLFVKMLVLFMFCLTMFMVSVS